MTTSEPQELVAVVRDSRGNTSGEAAIYPNMFIIHTGVTPSGNGTATVRPGTMVQLFARYQAPQDMPQGKISSSVFSNIGVRHQFMNNKASLNLAVVDPFDLFRFSDAPVIERLHFDRTYLPGAPS